MLTPPTYGKSFSVLCPKCGAEPYRRCWSMASKVNSNFSGTPHRERREAAKARERGDAA